MVRVFLTIFLSLYGVSCFAAEQGRKLVVLFTTDLHSQILPHKDSTGGLVKIATIVEQQRRQAQENGDAFLLLDGGDIAMGSIFHTLFATEAVEYRALARIGYDASTFGNHDFDFGTDALRSMFSVARSKEPQLCLPQLLCVNLIPVGGDTSVFWNNAIKKYLLFERNGVKAGVFGVMGNNAYEVISSDISPLRFSDPIEESGKAVAALQAEGAEYIIAISHGGALNGDDKELASKVKGIDFIISAHDHQLLHNPIKVNGTPIGAAGAYGEWVGKAVFSNGRLESYTLIEVGKDVQPLEQLEQWADSMYCLAGEKTRNLSGISLNDTLTVLEKDFPKQPDEEGRMALGSNIAASYAAAAEELYKDFPKDRIVGVVPYGMVRKGLEKGAVTGNDAFEVLSLGRNEAGYSGYPLVCAWLTGEELADLCELNVSVAPYLEDMRLFFSGLQYRYNGARLPFLRVDRVMVGGKPAEADSLYMIVTGSYTAALIGLLEKESYGFLSANAKDAQGNPLNPDKIPCLRTQEGNQVPEWVAFAGYLQKGMYNPAEGIHSVENDDFVPLGYTLLAILVCAAVLSLIGRRR